MKKRSWTVELVLLITAINSSADERADDGESLSQSQNTGSYIERLLKTPQSFFLLTHSGQADTSIFLQTIRAFFTSDGGLLAHQYSLVYLNFSDLRLSFFRGLKRQIQEVGLAYGIKIFKKNPLLEQFSQLIDELSWRKQENRKSIILLVDEYDWPILAHLETQKGEELREFLKSFFVLLRTNARKLKLVFVTGATKITSGVNNFVDLTNDPESNALRGRTEIVPPNKINSSFEEVVEAMKKLYSDYLSCGALSTDVQLGMEDIDIRQHWHASRPPEYVFDYFSDRYLLVDAVSGIRVSRDHLLTPYDPNKEFPIDVFMILKGYLTYRDYDNRTNEFIIDYPSINTKLDFVRAMWLSHVRAPTQFAIAPTTLKRSLVEGRVREFIAHLNNLSVLNLRHPEEYRLGKVVASILGVCQIACRSGHRFRRQDSTLAGDIDLETLDLPVNYVIEFKWLKTAEKAFEKLLRYSNVTSFQRAYADRSVYLVGINFAFVSHRIMVNEWIKVEYSDGRCSDLETSNEEYAKKFEHITRPNLLCNALYRHESS